jgi:diguanylate cyclase (GGDEF)-like protein
MATIPPLDDARRLSVLHSLEILDTPAEPEYDDLAMLATTVCSSPTAAVNFVDGERHFTKAIVGMPGAEGTSVPNDLSFCAATLQEPDGVLVIPDTRGDAASADHPLVTGGPRVGSYAGVALTCRGERVGVLCAFGPDPRPVTAAQRAALETLARQVEAQLELRRRNAELSRLAVSDPLTGLGNRTLLFDRLELALAEQARSGRPVGVLFCDIDDFKGVNDRHGHEVGDRVLCDVAEHLRGNVRAVDTVARIAGDEFVVICPAVTESQLDDLVQRLGQTDHRLLPNGARGPHLSIGAVVTTPDDTAATALRRADEAMYARKRIWTARRGAPMLVLGEPADPAVRR